MRYRYRAVDWQKNGEFLEKYGTSDVPDYLKISQETCVETLRELANHEHMIVRATVAENSNTTTEILDILYARLEGDEDRCNDASASVIAANENTSAETLRRFAQSWFDAETQAALCGNQNTPVDILERFVRSSFDIIREALATNPVITPELIDILSMDDSDDARAAIAGNPSTSRIVLERLSKDLAHYVKVAVAANQKCPGPVKKKSYEEATGLLVALGTFLPEEEYTVNILN